MDCIFNEFAIYNMASDWVQLSVSGGSAFLMTSRGKHSLESVMSALATQNIGTSRETMFPNGSQRFADVR